MKKIVIISFALVLVITGTSLQAQEIVEKPIREVGIGTSNLSNDFRLIYKKQIEEAKYRRYDISIGLGYSNFGRGFNSGVGYTYLSLRIATEKRNYINDKFKFVHGIYYGASTSASIFSIQQNDSISAKVIPVVGYQLGFQYDINDKFYIGATTFPGINAEFSVADDEIWLSNLSLRFVQTAELSVLYRF